ncbi:large conductance mechanosensitive channel protein MscL [Granulicella arctica]|uniref:large conductance mechanosensitive channel protein MscL n=1 Tax=Granulicella arctica TaxID=940613 RepID=UPI0021E023CD
MLKGFRDFILRGNVIDLAVAVIIGAAFTAIVTALVTDIITPLISAIVGKPDFSYLILTVNGGKVQYGLFLNAVISFVLMAGVVYFFLVVPINYLLARVKGPAAVTEKTCGECLSEIPLTAKRCKFCAQPVA